MSLADEIAQELSTQMQSEMDFHILSDMLVKLGWKKVVVAKLHHRKRQIIINQWCDEHIKHSYECRYGVYIFENEGDAVNFTLKWLS